jgi:hypothetical protein
MTAPLEPKPVSLADLGQAGRGDLAALRRLREHWFQIASGNITVSLVPKEEALPQLELLAALAANGAGEANDWIWLAAIYRMRMDGLETDLTALVGVLDQVDEAGDIASHDRCSSAAIQLAERAADYRLKADEIVAQILAAEGVEGTAQIVALMEDEADRGWDPALPILQALFDSVSPERAQAIQSEVRKIEGVQGQ